MIVGGRVLALGSLEYQHPLSGIWSGAAFVDAGNAAGRWADWPAVRLPEDEAGRFLTGLRRRVSLADAPAVRVYGPHPRAFLGAAHITAGDLIPDRLLSPLEVRAHEA